jgi:hypothetical protein
MIAMKKLSVFLAAFAVAAVLPAGAQTHPKTVAEVIRVHVRPGDGPQWEAANKRVAAWQHQHNDPVSTYAWSVVAGKHTGQYFLGRFGLNWSDFDKLDKFDSSNGFGKELQATVAPYTESIERSIYEALPDVSSPLNPGQPPTAFSDVTFFRLKPGSMQAVMDVIKQANEAIRKTNWPGGKSHWYRLVDGGEYPQLVLSSGHQDWADFQSPSPSFEAILNQTFGKVGAKALGHEFNEHVKSVHGEILRYRPDLSYIASPQ